MSRKTFIILIIIITAIFLVTFFALGNQSPKKLVSSLTISVNQKITPTPTPTPIIYNYNSSTDLKSELETINPEVLDSDFSDLKNVTSTL